MWIDYKKKCKLPEKWWIKGYGSEGKGLNLFCRNSVRYHLSKDLVLLSTALCFMYCYVPMPLLGIYAEGKMSFKVQTV